MIALNEWPDQFFNAGGFVCMYVCARGVDRKARFSLCRKRANPNPEKNMKKEKKPMFYTVNPATMRHDPQIHPSPTYLASRPQTPPPPPCPLSPVFFRFFISSLPLYFYSPIKQHSNPNPNPLTHSSIHAYLLTTTTRSTWYEYLYYINLFWVCVRYSLVLVRERGGVGWGVDDR